MNKELFVSSTPHETKVGLVEDDLLAEVYLERENEYTLAGSIYKGRVTRVLPGMQSAFVDIGLERDAFLYVSDFMELEEHDDDLTETVPANRGVQDMRSPSGRGEAAKGAGETAASPSPESILQADTEEGSIEAENLGDAPLSTAENAEPGNAAESQNRDRGSWRGRRRRRGGRRDGRDRGPERGPERGGDRDRGGERSSESRFSRPAESRTPAGPPPGYQPILLPGESISKYQRWSQQPAVQEPQSREAVADVTSDSSEQTASPIAAAFPEDEPIFASGQSLSEPLHEQHEDAGTIPEEPVESASTSAGWNREFRRPEESNERASAWATASSPLVEHAVVQETKETEEETQEEETQEEETQESDDRINSVSEHRDQPTPSYRQDQTPVFAEPGTMEEETIDEEEADAVHYQASSDDSYDEFEEETRAADQPEHLNGDARETVSEIHMASISESGEAPAGEAAPVEGEEDTEELELEEAQAEAEAILDAEARGNGTVDARAEVRAPAATVGYTQRSQRQRPDRPGYERRGGGDRSRRGGGARRFRRRESAPVPLISDLLKEGQEILVQIAKEPIGKKGARITSHIALPGRFLVYMPTVNHTGVSRKISSEEERHRLKRIILSERQAAEGHHGGFIVRTAAAHASEEDLRADIRFLLNLWNEIRSRADSSKSPALIYHDLNLVERILRDQVSEGFSHIWVDNEQEYERIVRFVSRFQPQLVKRVKLYTKETPLFEQFNIQEEINKALKSKVWLKSGGYIVINQTEALVAIDVNTGKFVGKTQKLEDTIVKTNVDAIKEIVRQVRLRDLGG